MSSQSEPIVTTGVSGLANRREIHDLVQDETQFSLYIQALSMFMLYVSPFTVTYDTERHRFKQLNYSNLDRMTHRATPFPSFRSGVSTACLLQSGMVQVVVPQWGPGMAIARTGRRFFRPGTDHTSLCLRLVSNLSNPAWSLAYQPSIQQALQKQAVEIAKTYTQDRPRWEKAAQDLRAPYWDWALYTFPPEEVISKDIVEIITPDGRRTPVENPLLRYTFNPIDSSFEDLFKVWKTTLRHPTPPDSPDAKTNVKSLKEYVVHLGFAIHTDI